MHPAADARWMGVALTLAARGLGRTAHCPAVGCVIVRDGRVAGRGWTQPGGRPHAEAMALLQAGEAARGATAYVTLEPCAHEGRGPACTDLLVAAGVARVVVACGDPDPRTHGAGIARLRQAGIAVTEDVRAADAQRLNAGFMCRQIHGRPHVTLKLALSLDGQIAMASGESQWITGTEARAHAHLMRAQSDLILIGRGTLLADDPLLDVRLPGLEDRTPPAAVLSASLSAVPARFRLAGRNPLILRALDDLVALPAVNHVLVEGGAAVAGAFLAADMVDRLIVYRAPIILGHGRPAIAGFAPEQLAAAHGRWQFAMGRRLGKDALEVYERALES